MCEDGCDFFGGNVAAADVEKGSDEIADHVMEESVAANFVDEKIAFFDPCRREDGADVVRRNGGLGLACGKIGVGGGEGGEVVFADDECSGALHFVEVERPIERIDVAGEPGRTDFSPVDSVLVSFCADAVSGVEVRRCVLGVEDADGGGECAIEGAEQVRRRDERSELEGCDLSAGMDAGVGASAALRENMFVGDACDGGGDLALNGRLSRLDLPAVEISAVVGERELPIHVRLIVIFSDFGATEEVLGLLGGVDHQIAYDILKFS